MNKILVTGASGLIGSHLCKRLVLADYEVVGLVHTRRSPIIDSISERSNFKTYAGSILDEDFVYDVIKENNINSVIHLVAHLPYTPNKDRDLLGVNCRGTQMVLEGAYFNKVEQFIYASSMSVYSIPPDKIPVDEDHPKNPSNTYGVTKLAGESFCKSYSGDMSVTILRYAGVYGIGMDGTRAIARFVKHALKDQSLTVFGGGVQSSDFLYVNDATDGTYLAWLKNKPDIYNIGSGQETKVIDLANKIVELCGSKSSVTLSPEETDRPFRFVADITKARKELGYLPSSLNEGLRRYLEEAKQETGK